LYGTKKQLAFNAVDWYNGLVNLEAAKISTAKSPHMVMGAVLCFAVLKTYPEEDGA